MVMDDKREFTLEKVTKNRIVGSDHNTIVADFDFSPIPYQKNISNKDTEYKWVLSKEALQRFKNETEKGTLGEIWDQLKGTIEDLYTMWIRNLNKTLKSNVKRIFKKGSKKGNIKENLGISSIRREKRMLKKKLLNAVKDKNKSLEDILKVKIRLINKKIQITSCSVKRKQIVDQLEKMKNFCVNSTEFFKLRKVLLGHQPTIQSSVISENGEQLKDSDAILKECEEYFKRLLTNREPMKEYRK